MLLARISLTLSLSLSLPFSLSPSLAMCPYRPLLLAVLQDYILYPYWAIENNFLLVCEHSTRPCEGFQRITLFMCFPAVSCMFYLPYLDNLKIGGWWQYSCSFVGWFFQDLINVTHSIFVHFLSSFFSIRLDSVPVVHPNSRINTTDRSKKLCFFLLDKSDLRKIDYLSIAVHIIASRILMSFLVDRTLFPR